MKWLLTFLMLLGLSAKAATYYASLTGNDANPGTLAEPWTLGYAISNVVAGDTVLVQPGIYTVVGEAKHFSQADGSSGSRIHVKANGNVTNSIGIDLAHDYWTIDGFYWTALYGESTACYVRTNVSNLIWTNNTVLNCVNSALAMVEGNGQPHGAAQNCLIISNRFLYLSNNTAITLFGAGHTVSLNQFKDFNAMDCIRGFGSNHLITCNYFTNLYTDETYGNHPDVYQCFGDAGGWGNGVATENVIFSRNYIINSPIQLLRPTLDGVTNHNTNLWVINNLFYNSDMQSGINYPGVRYYNNTFYHCNFESQTLMQFNYYDPTNYTAHLATGSSYGGQVKNNVIIDSGNLSYSYGAVPSFWDGDSWAVDYVLTMIPPTDLDADYNYVCWTNWGAKTGFTEPNGINGSNPGYANITNLDFTLATNSLIYKAGTPLAEVTVDFYGNARLNPPSIGAFEFVGETPAIGRHDIPSTIIFHGR